jgi:hypothetical protein
MAHDKVWQGQHPYERKKARDDLLPLHEPLQEMGKIPFEWGQGDCVPLWSAGVKPLQTFAKSAGRPPAPAKGLRPFNPFRVGARGLYPLVVCRGNAHANNARLPKIGV